jgi:hypothetical protein
MFLQEKRFFKKSYTFLDEYVIENTGKYDVT